MARRGRFGRSETGASDLSQTIRSLVQQQLAAEEQMLFKSFYEGTSFGGSVPSYSDLVSFVNERLGQGSVSDAQMAYYETLLSQAKKFEVGNTFNDLKSSFYGTQGQNYDEMVSFLRGEGSEYADELYGFTKDYVTKYLYSDLSSDRIDETEFMSRSQSALNAFVDDAALYDDVKYDVYSSLYEYQLGEQSDILSRTNPSKAKQVLKANEGLLAFYRSWEAKLNENGISGDFLDTVRNNIAKTKFAVQENRQKVADNAAAALLSSREAAYGKAKATVDAFARDIAPYVGIDSSDPDFSFNDIPAATFASFLNDISPENQLQVRSALGELRGAARSYSQTLQSQGDPEKALEIRNVSTAANLVSGNDISFEKYIAGSERKDALMALADKVPSDELAVTKEWVKFLRGQTTAMFGEGINPSNDQSGREVAINITNEANAIESALNGKKLGAIPKTYIDDFMSSQSAQLGLSNSASDFYNQEFTGDNKHTARELSDIEITMDLDNRISRGDMVILRVKDPQTGGYKTDYIDAGSPSPAGGRMYRVEKTASGSIVTVAYDGTPIYGSIAGQPDKNSQWGYAYETKDGMFYADGKTKKVYVNPPFNTNPNVFKRSGLDNAFIISDIDRTTDQRTGFPIITGIRTTGSGVEASLSDYIDPSALEMLQNPGVNPYAKISPQQAANDPRIVGAIGITSNLRRIIDGFDDLNPEKEKAKADLLAIEINLDSLTSRSEDSGVRVAQMNADLAKKAAATATTMKTQLPAAAPVAPRLNPFSPVQTGANLANAEAAKLGQDILGNANVFFRELGKIGGAIGQAGLMAGGALAYGIPSAIGGAISAGVNFALPGIPGASGAGATSSGPKPLSGNRQIDPLQFRPLGVATPRTTSPGAGLTLTAQPFVEFRAGERASRTISTPKTTTAPRAMTPPTGRIGL